MQTIGPNFLKKVFKKFFKNSVLKTVLKKGNTVEICQTESLTKQKEPTTNTAPKISTEKLESTVKIKPVTGK